MILDRVKKMMRPRLVHVAALAGLLLWTSDSQSQDVGSRKKDSLVAHLKVGNTEGRRTKQVVYQLADGWVIAKQSVHEVSQYGISSYSVSRLQAKSQLVTSTQIQESYRSLREYVGNFGISDVVKVDVLKRLREEEEQNIRQVHQFASSHETVLCEVTAKGRGLGQGGSSIKVSIDFDLVYVGTPNDQHQREQRWRKRINSLANNGGNGNGGAGNGGAGNGGNGGGAGAAILSKSAKLVHSDPTSTDGKHFHSHAVRLEAGKSYTIDLVSRDFDAYLQVKSAAGMVLAHDDDSGGNRNARIVFRPTQTGMYNIIATTFAHDATGAYTLTVR